MSSERLPPQWLIRLAWNEATVVAMVADGMTAREIVGELPDPGEEDVAEALRYAAEAVSERRLPLNQPA